LGDKLRQKTIFCFKNAGREGCGVGGTKKVNTAGTCKTYPMKLVPNFIQPAFSPQKKPNNAYLCIETGLCLFAQPQFQCPLDRFSVAQASLKCWLFFDIIIPSLSETSPTSRRPIGERQR
jgi:hypothetical protein